MKLSGVRLSLLSIFLGGLVAQMAALISLRDSIWPDELQAGLVKLLSIYSVPLSIILGALFGQWRTQKRSTQNTLAWTAILLSLLWNILLGCRSILFALASQDSISDLIRYLDAIGSASSFLVAGMLALFF
jgi:hypothetical protein